MPANTCHPVPTRRASRLRPRAAHRRKAIWDILVE